MDKWILSLFTTVIITGCSTVPSDPAPHSEKYTFQVITIEIPGDMPGYQNTDEKMTGFEFNEGSSLPASLTFPGGDLEKLIQHPEPTGLTIPSGDLERIIQHSDAEISEYPIVLAGLGESVTNDQTRSVWMPEDYEIVNGKAVAKERIFKLGYSTSVTVNKIENGKISYHINASYREFSGFDEHKTDAGVLKMPFFNVRGFNTRLTQHPNSWVSFGGYVDETNGEKRSSMTCVRIIPPKS